MLKFNSPKNQSSIIKVIGVGGGGSNAVTHMFKQGIKGVDFVICNTDAQALNSSPIPTKIQLGVKLTEGMGAGSDPAIGKQAAIENIKDINAILKSKTKMLFITAGMGGGTGTGGAPIIAETAKKLDILTVGIVTIPFSFEGRKRTLIAEQGIKELKKHVDTILIISNDKLRDLCGDLKLSEAFSKADDVLTIAAKGIAEIITVPGYINVDFKDVNTVMKNSGVAIMGSGTSEGENRALSAVEDAISSPLLNDNDIRGASDILLYIASGKDEVSMDEVSIITDYIKNKVGPYAYTIWGTGTDESLENKISITLIATGFNKNKGANNSNNKIIIPLNEQTKEEIEKRKINKENPEKNLKNEIKLINKNLAKQQNIKPQLKNNNLIKKTTSLFDFDISDNEIKENEKELDTSKTKTFINKDKEEKINMVKSIKVHQDINENKLSKEKDSNNKRSVERIKHLKEISMKLKSPEELYKLENEPAFIRKKVKLTKNKQSSESEISRYSLFEDDDNDIELKSNNSFLHDNVD